MLTTLSNYACLHMEIFQKFCKSSQRRLHFSKFACSPIFFTPNCKYLYTDITVISVAFRNSDLVSNNVSSKTVFDSTHSKKLTMGGNSYDLGSNFWSKLNNLIQNALHWFSSTLKKSNLDALSWLCAAHAIHPPNQAFYEEFSTASTNIPLHVNFSKCSWHKMFLVK